MSSVDIPALHVLDFKDKIIELSTKPGVELHYTFNSSTNIDIDSSAYLLVCLNGLLTPQASWFPALFELKKNCKGQNIPCPAILTYDRWSQGRTTDSDPLDSLQDRDSGYGHTIEDVADDLHQLLLQLTNSTKTSDLPPLIFLANSIGCAISRIYAAKYPGTIHAFIFLDSMMANTDFSSLWPDPDSPSFNPAKDLPDGTSVDQLRHARGKYIQLFHPSVKNPENFDRRDLRDKLPYSDSPLLPCVERTGDRPLLVVTGHDPQTFAREGEERLGITPPLTLMYPHAAWQRYNEGLVQLTNPDKAKGPLIADGCGHFVQKDRPTFVAELVSDMLCTLTSGESSY